MKASVNILDFDGVYNEQDYFENTNYKWINLLDIQHANRYCEKESLDRIDKRMKNAEYSDITFIGSGNYHYVSYLIIEEIKEPFTLIVFDHHTDMMEAACKNLLSCGSWILKSLESLENLKKVILIGIDKSIVDTIPEHLKNKVFVISEYQLKEEYIEKIIENEIETDNAYISIDKDVLEEKFAATNWDQGKMTLYQLLKVLKCISCKNKVCGIDVCGEYPYNPIDKFSKEASEAIKINNESNFEILVKAKEILEED